MAKQDLVNECTGCLKADRKGNKCLAFTEPAYMWRNKPCWGYQPKVGVYLAGSINGHSIWAKAVNWRLNTAITLETLGYQVFNPLRGRKPEDQNSNDIVERDLQDITKADILLVEMDHKDKAYIGTAMEIRYAWERGKEIVIWGQANKESHWLKYHATAWFDDLDQALDYLRERRAKTSDSYSRRIKTCPERMASSATRIHDGRTRVCRSSGF